MKLKYLWAGVAFSLAALCFPSCSSHSEGSSFTSQLDSIDVLISQNSNESAIKALVKLERKAYSSYERLGIYKRYILLGEKISAEKVLARGLKKLGGNAELSAVYANFLLRENRLEEAFEISRCLENSAYSSIYAECVLSKAFVSIENQGEVLEEAFSSVKKKGKKSRDKANGSPIATKELFCNEKFVPIYVGAYKGSGDSRWIYNAASVLMKSGEYKAASELYPNKISNYADSLFWGGVFFDGGFYAQSLSALEASERLASLDGKGDYSPELYSKILALEADCTYVEGDDKGSEALREKLISIDGGRFASPHVYMNGAMYSKRQGNPHFLHERLEKLLSKYPDYIPGLFGYAEFAIDQMNVPEEDVLSKELRSAGIKTLEMERRDRIPVVTLENVFEKLDSLENGREPMVVVLRDILTSEKFKSEKKERSVSDIWGMLESNESQNAYPEEIVKYAVEYFCSRGMTGEAQGLFEGYMKKKYDFDYMKNPSDLELWECEYGAWFACQGLEYRDGIDLYRFIVDRYGSRIPALNSSSSNRSVVNSLVNLALVYACIDRSDEALSLLNSASSKAADAKEKAEILYRMAEINWTEGDSRSAARSLKYVLSLDKEHNRARLLLKKIRAEK